MCIYHMRRRKGREGKGFFLGGGGYTNTVMVIGYVCVFMLGGDPRPHLAGALLYLLYTHTHTHMHMIRISDS